MNKKPYFSVVMPTFNRANIIRKSIESVLSQTFKNFELIIVDNNSSDNTENIINSFDDERIFLKKINNEGIVAKSRNLGVKIATSEYIAFIDSDDLWSEDKLEQCILEIKKGNNFIYHNFSIYKNGKKINEFKGRQLKNNQHLDLYKNGNCIFNSGVVIKKTFLENIGLIPEDREFIGCEDFITWFKITKNFKSTHLAKNLGSYNLDGNNLTNPKLSEINSKALKIFFEKELKDHEYKNYPQWLGYKLCKSLYDQRKLTEFFSEISWQYFFPFNNISLKLCYLYIHSKFIKDGN